MAPNVCARVRVHAAVWRGAGLPPSSPCQPVTQTYTQTQAHTAHCHTAHHTDTGRRSNTHHTQHTDTGQHSDAHHTVTHSTPHGHRSMKQHTSRTAETQVNTLMHHAVTQHITQTQVGEATHPAPHTSHRQRSAKQHMPHHHTHHKDTGQRNSPRCHTQYTSQIRVMHVNKIIHTMTVAKTHTATQTHIPTCQMQHTPSCSQTFT